MIGLHGCDVSVRNDLVTKPDTIKISQKNFHWLGHGFYVWENNYERALSRANDKKKRRGTPEAFKPSVVGVFYELDYCLDLTNNLPSQVLRKIQV